MREIARNTHFEGLSGRCRVAVVAVGGLLDLPCCWWSPGRPGWICRRGGWIWGCAQLGLRARLLVAQPARGSAAHGQQGGCCHPRLLLFWLEEAPAWAAAREGGGSPATVAVVTLLQICKGLSRVEIRPSEEDGLPTGDWWALDLQAVDAVSYTHLTLPTIYSV